MARNEFKKYHDFIRDIADIFHERPENLSMSIDIWGHWDAIYPVLRVYAVNVDSPNDLLFVGKHLGEIITQARDLRARMDEKG